MYYPGYVLSMDSETSGHRIASLLFSPPRAPRARRVTYACRQKSTASQVTSTSTKIHHHGDDCIASNGCRPDQGGRTDSCCSRLDRSPWPRAPGQKGIHGRLQDLSPSRKETQEAWFMGCRDR